MVNKGNLTKHLCKHLLIVQCKCLSIHLVLCLKSQLIQFHEHHNFNIKYNLLIQKHHHQKDVCIHYLSLNLQNLRSKLNCFWALNALNHQVVLTEHLYFSHERKMGVFVCVLTIVHSIRKLYQIVFHYHALMNYFLVYKEHSTFLNLILEMDIIRYLSLRSRGHWLLLRVGMVHLNG